MQIKNISRYFQKHFINYSKFLIMRLPLRISKQTRTIFSRLVLFVTIMSGAPYLAKAQVSINNDGSAPDASSMLEVKATGKGFLPPRMGLTNRPSSPALGLLYYQTDNTPGFYYYNGSWQKLGLSANDYWLANGSDIYYNSGRVAIGTNTSDGNGLQVINYHNARGAVKGVSRLGDFIYTEAYLAMPNAPDYGIPDEPSVFNIAVLGVKFNAGSNGAAVYGWNSDDNSTNYGGVFVTDGTTESSTTRYGVYSLAKGNNPASYTTFNYGIYSEAGNADYNYAGKFTGIVHVDGHSTTNAEDYHSTVFKSTVVHTDNNNTKAIEGNSNPAPGYGVGVSGNGSYKGIEGHSNATTYSGSAYGIYGKATGTNGSRYGVYGISENSGNYGYGVYGVATGSTTANIGVYGYSYGAATNWAGYFLGNGVFWGDLRIGSTTKIGSNMLSVHGSAYIENNLTIGTTSKATGYELSVDGDIACEEVLVEDDGSWPDYVFKNDYPLRNISEVEILINENGHLPGIPSASDIEKNGQHLGDMQKRLLEKIEELTLYLIQQNKRIDQLEAELEQIKKDNSK